MRSIPGVELGLLVGTLLKGVYNKDFTSIIDIYFYETFSTLKPIQ